MEVEPNFPKARPESCPAQIGHARSPMWALFCDHFGDFACSRVWDTVYRPRLRRLEHSAEYVVLKALDVHLEEARRRRGADAHKQCGPRDEGAHLGVDSLGLGAFGRPSRSRRSLPLGSEWSSYPPRVRGAAKSLFREVAASRGTTKSALSTCKPTPSTTRLSAPMHSRWKNTRVLMAAGGAVAAGTVQSKVCTVQFVRRNTCHASRGGQRCGERGDESGQLCWAVAGGWRGGVVGLTSSSNSHSPFEPIEMTTHGGRCWLSPHARFSPSPRPYVSRGVAAARGATRAL